MRRASHLSNGSCRICPARSTVVAVRTSNSSRHAPREIVSPHAMKATIRTIDEDHMLLVVLEPGELTHEDRAAARCWRGLHELVAQAFGGQESSRSSRLPLVAVDVSACAQNPRRVEQWLEFGALPGVNRVQRFVLDRAGRLEFFGIDLRDAAGATRTAPTLEAAIARLQGHRAIVQGTIQRAKSLVANRATAPRIALVGCPTKDFGPLPAELTAAGAVVISAEEVADDGAVVFCISTAEGPTEGTRRSVIGLSGKTVRPLAVVLVSAEVVDDDSLRALVSLEERELLRQVLPDDIVDQLEVHLDLDPTLPAKLIERASTPVPSVLCRAVSR